MPLGPCHSNDNKLLDNPSHADNNDIPKNPRNNQKTTVLMCFPFLIWLYSSAPPFTAHQVIKSFKIHFLTPLKVFPLVLYKVAINQNHAKNPKKKTKQRKKHPKYITLTYTKKKVCPTKNDATQYSKT